MQASRHREITCMHRCFNLEPAAWRSSDSSPVTDTVPEDVLEESVTQQVSCFLLAPEDPSQGLRAGRFMGERESGGKSGRRCWCTLFERPGAGAAVCSLVNVKWVWRSLGFLRVLLDKPQVLDTARDGSWPLSIDSCQYTKSNKAGGSFRLSYSWIY